MVKIKFKKLCPEAVEPKRAHKSDAGWDLTAVSRDWDAEQRVYVYGTGIAVEIPEGYAGLLFPRSSIANKDLLLTNAVGIIDSGYRGEIMAKFCQRDDGGSIYGIGERIAQLVISPVIIPEIEIVDELNDTERGTGGFGSTGKA